MLLKHLLIGLLLLFTVIAFGADRAHQDQDAKATFLDLQFFTEGRGMHTVPNIINLYKNTVGLGLFDQTMRQRWGFNVLEKHKTVGLFDVSYQNMNVAVLGCVACHSSKAAGQFIVGLGNKNIDVFQVGKDIQKIQSTYGSLVFFKSDEYKRVEKSAIEFADLLANDQIGNLTQGMIPVSFVRSWFYRQAGLEWPKNMTKGAVKIPALWGYGEKRKVGQFSDGYGNGNLPGWAVAVELTAGQTPETVRSYLPRVQQAEDLLGQFLPPKYPFAINEAMAVQGAKVFEKTCQHCHGSYEKDAEGLPVFKSPNWIPLEVVQTDSDRLEANTPEFNDLVRHNPLSDIIQYNDFGRGFFSPRLDGIWARFPYLHNGSVPSVAALLTPPEARPVAFSLVDAGEKSRFDENQLGLTLPQSGSSEESQLLAQGQAGARNVYFTRRVGHSSQGHPFGISLSDGDKRSLIEFLKTL